MRRHPITFRPPLSPELHGPAIVHLQTWAEEADTRLTELETFRETLERWRERLVWGVAMASLVFANMGREQAIDLFVKVFVTLLGG
jgi:uncharacterized membrane protein YjjP (DUF1212 family)